jgi:sec-independent protein translocase protein TatC
MSEQDNTPKEPAFLSHLIELRDRLLRSVLVVVLLLLPLLYFANDLYSLLAEPLLRHMPQGTQMIATEVASPFLTPFKLALIAAIFIAVPYLLYQAWAFIAPGLYQHEQKLVIPLMVSSTLLFYAGIAFAYYVVFPLVFGFFIGIAPEGVAVMTDISKYLDFVLKLFIAFGIAFEVPIATILMCWTGMTTPDKLAEKRAYVIVGAFVIGMLMTPPDIVSQTLLAMPMWMLFEAGLFFARRMPKRDADEYADSDVESETENTIMPPAAAATAAIADTAVEASEAVEGSESEPEATVSAEGGLEEEEPYEELSDEEMEAELDRMDEEDEDDEVIEETTKPDASARDKDKKQ